MHDRSIVAASRPSDVDPANRGIDHVLRILSDLLRILLDLGAKVDSLHECLSQRSKSHYTVGEIADITGRSEYTVRRWIAEKRIHAIRVTDTGPRGKLLIPRSEIAKLIDAGRGGGLPTVVDAADHSETAPSLVRKC